MKTMLSAIGSAGGGHVEQLEVLPVGGGSHELIRRCVKCSRIFW